jgi:hypothetical protein
MNFVEANGGKISLLVIRDHRREALRAGAMSEARRPAPHRSALARTAFPRYHCAFPISEVGTD